MTPTPRPPPRPAARSQRPEQASLCFQRTRCARCGGWIEAGGAAARTPGEKGLHHAGGCPGSAPLAGVRPIRPLTGPPLKLPHGCALLPFQEEGVRLLMTRKRTLLADSMGCGKSVQCACFIGQHPDWQKVLVVCPPSLRYNWRRELGRWLPDGRAVGLWPEEGDGDPILIAGYNRLAGFASRPLDLVVFDESQAIKNTGARRTGEAQRVARGAERVLAMCGNPIEDRHRDLWTLLSMLGPEEWDPPGLCRGRPVGVGEGAGERAFLKRYCGLKMHMVQVATRRDGSPIYKRWEDARASTRGEELHARLSASGLMIRRTKAEVLPQLPKKVRELVVLPPEGEAAAAVEEEHAAFHETGLDYAADVALLVKAQVEFRRWAEARKRVALAKVPLVIEHVRRVLDSERKVVVLGHHVEALRAIWDAFLLEEAALYYGATPEQERDREVRRFQEDPACRVFVGGLTSAGTGLTLTAARVLVFAEIDGRDPRQAEDRVHRIGQAESVLIQTLVFDLSVDANLARLAGKKMNDSDRALDGRVGWR